MYRLESRITERTGHVMQLSMLSILSASSKALSVKQTASAMARLKQTIADTLRRGDVFTQFSGSQYLILLPYASFENGTKVLKRLIGNFKRAYPTMNVQLQFSVLPLVPDSLQEGAATASQNHLTEKSLLER